MNGRLNLVVTVMLVLCALSLVNAQYHARSLFIELERAQAARPDFALTRSASAHLGGARGRAAGQHR